MEFCDLSFFFLVFLYLKHFQSYPYSKISQNLIIFWDYFSRTFLDYRTILKSTLIQHNHPKILSLHLVTLSVIHPMSLKIPIITHISHYSIMQSIFFALKIVCDLPVISNPIPWTFGSHWSFTVSRDLPQNAI